MPRRVQDIIPNSHRSIRDTPVERDKTPVPIRAPKARKKIIYVIMGVVVIVACLAYSASVYFSHARFSIMPKIIPVSVNGPYISKNTPNTDALNYELLIVKETSSASVVATNGPKISVSAKGKITLYNAFSSQSQRLIAGTRLSDSSNRVYRLSSSVVIPGYVSKSNTNVPGSIVASITADQPGQAYNISHSDSVSDFKVVAYKGSPKYNTIYGRLATDVSGGFVGTQKTVNPILLATTTSKLQDKITSSLLTKVRKTIPDGYIMYKNAYVTSFSIPLIKDTDPKLVPDSLHETATISLEGTLYAIIFKKNDLILRLAGELAVATFEPFQYDAIGLESLDFSIANQKDFSVEKKNTLIIKIKGEFKLVGSIPVEILKNKLAGLSLSETESVLRSYKPIIEIEKSSGEITPQWSKVPSDPARIDIEVLTR